MQKWPLLATGTAVVGRYIKKGQQLEREGKEGGWLDLYTWPCPFSCELWLALLIFRSLQLNSVLCICQLNYFLFEYWGFFPLKMSTSLLIKRCILVIAEAWFGNTTLGLKILSLWINNDKKNHGDSSCSVVLKNFSSRIIILHKRVRHFEWKLGKTYFYPQLHNCVLD